MDTKPLTHRSLRTLDLSDDLKTIRRFLVAAAISPNFCRKLLRDPQEAVLDGFGGEQFPLSEPTLQVLGSIRVSSLPELIYQLNHCLSGRLLVPESTDVIR